MAGAASKTTCRVRKARETLARLASDPRYRRIRWVFVAGSALADLGFWYHVGALAIGAIAAVVAFFAKNAWLAIPAGVIAWAATEVALHQRATRHRVAPKMLASATEPEVAFALVKPTVELVGDNWGRDELTFASRSLIWVTVTNDGDQADFSARFSLHTSTARREFPTAKLLDDYADDAAWENSKDRRISIGHKGTARLLLIWSFAQPHAFWFLLPEKQLYGPGYASGWILSPLGSAIEFDLQVVNEKTKQTISALARLSFGADGNACSFLLDEPRETLQTEINDAYKRGINRPNTQVTRLTNLRSRLGELGEENVTNVKVMFTAADQFPLARDIASVFESLPGWTVTFYDTPQPNSDWFEGIRVRGYLSHLVNDAVGALLADGAPRVEPDIQQLQVTADNPKYRSSQHSLRITVGYPPPVLGSKGGRR